MSSPAYVPTPPAAPPHRRPEQPAHGRPAQPADRAGARAGRHRHRVLRRRPSRTGCAGCCCSPSPAGWPGSSGWCCRPARPACSPSAAAWTSCTARAGWRSSPWWPDWPCPPERGGENGRGTRCMTTHRVTLIPGDGVGPELTEATRRVLEAAVATGGWSFDWDVQQAGVDIMETAGTPLPHGDARLGQRNKVAIKGPITTPIGTGFRSVNVALRGELELYACLRPCKIYPGMRTRFDAGRRRHRPREHRGPLRRHRVRVRHAGGRQGHRVPQRPAEEADPRRAPASRSSRSASSARSGSSATPSSTRRPRAASGSTASPRATS